MNQLHSCDRMLEKMSSDTANSFKQLPNFAPTIVFMKTNILE